MNAASVHIGCVRARRRGEGAPDRSALCSMMTSADLHPAGLPPASILLVRRVAGAVQTSRSLSAGAAWQRAVRERLARFTDSAVRPTGGRVPAAAEAILLADEAELLACLARDVAAGRAGERWFWRSALTAMGISTNTDLIRLLLRNIGHVPAACDLWLRWGCGEEVLAQMRPSDATVVTVELCRELNLGAPLTERDLVDARLGDLASASGASLIGDDGAGPHATEARSIALRLDQAVRPAMPLRRLGFERFALAAVGLAAHRAPMLLMHVTPARLRTWMTGATAEPDAGVEAHGRTIRPPTVEHRADSERSHAEPRRDEVRKTGGLTPRVDPSMSHDGPHGEAGDATPLVQQDRRDLRSHHDRPPGDPPPSTELDAVSKPSRRYEADHAGLSTGTASAETGLAGIFYLINLMARFWDAKAGASVIGPATGWPVIEVLARGLLDAAGHGEEARADAVWRLLARLDGRDDDASAAIGAATGSAIDRWLQRGAMTNADSEADPDVRPPTSHTVADDPRLVLRISVGLAGLLCDRLADQSRIADDDADGRDVVHRLLKRRGTVHVTPMHVDVVMDMKDVWLPARRTGLDVDPGWRPELGRVVRFHYHEGLFRA